MTGVLLLILMLFTSYLLFNAYNFKSTQVEVTPVHPAQTPDGAIDRMAEAISYRTISYQDREDFDSTQFLLFNDFLTRSYPLLHERSEHTIINQYSHLYKWEGRNTSLEPIILMGHLDVVPIASLALWSVHPFDEGVMSDTIYGRGTLDDKGSLISILEAVEQLMADGFIPDRTIYLSLGHDEEISGTQGATYIASYLESQNVKAAFVLDEGGVRVTGDMLGIDRQVALIGIAEKGFLSIELVVNMAGGHSSSPSSETSIDVLATAVSKLKKNPPKAHITEVLNEYLNKIGPEMGFTSKVIIANRGILGSLLVNQMANAKTGNAMVRTTTAPTIFEAGIKDNVIPTSARAVVNFRIIPGENINTVVEHIKKTITDDRISVEVMKGSSNPSVVSPVNNSYYASIERSIKEIFPTVLTTPNLVVAATDSRHFSNISPNIYRFTPFLISPDNMGCYHGIDERIPVSEYEDAIRFYTRVIVNAQGGK